MFQVRTYAGGSFQALLSCCGQIQFALTAGGEAEGEGELAFMWGCQHEVLSRCRRKSNWIHSLEDEEGREGRYEIVVAEKCMSKAGPNGPG